jgi:uncharacterized protein
MSKLSRFNHFQPWRDGYHIAYNAMSGAVALMTDENFEVYHRIAEKLASGTEPDFTDQEKELFKQLEYGHFLRKDTVDEIESLKFRHNMDRYDRTVLGLVLAPTLACNMACEYCYEANKKGRLSPQMIEKIVEFVEKRAPGIAGLETSWYGGEPLLAMDIIEDLTSTFMDLSEEYKFEYGASMISNGYLLSPKTTDRLVEQKIRSIQITLDGPGRIHNVKRPRKNGKPSFETIIKNIQYAVDKIAVGIRVNVDQSFTPGIIKELLQELIDAGVHEKVGLYFGQLEASTTVCSNISESCYETADFSKIEIEYYRLLLENNFRIDRLPSPMSTFCMAQVINSFLIDPDGDIYKCFNHVGEKEKKMGNIANEIDYRDPNFLHLFRFLPFEDETCNSCDFLPICMGGCPSRRSDRNMKGEQLCDSWRHNLEPMLEIIAMSRQQQQKKEAAVAAASEE